MWQLIERVRNFGGEVADELLEAREEVLHTEKTLQTVRGVLGRRFRHFVVNIAEEGWHRKPFADPGSRENTARRWSLGMATAVILQAKEERLGLAAAFFTGEVARRIERHQDRSSAQLAAEDFRPVRPEAVSFEIHVARVGTELRPDAEEGRGEFVEELLYLFLPVRPGVADDKPCHFASILAWRRQARPGHRGETGGRIVSHYGATSRRFAVVAGYAAKR